MGWPSDPPDPRSRLAGDRAGGPRGRRLTGRSRAAGTVLAGLGLAFVAIATLTPVHESHAVEATRSLTCLVCGDQGGADVVDNLLLFLPFAIGLRLRGTSWGATVLAAVLVSCTVETCQLWIPGRFTSLGDVVTNTASGALGATVAGAVWPALRPSGRLATRLCLGGSAIVLLGFALSAWLLAPWLPPDRLRSAWAHEAGERDVFAGRVVSVTLEGIAMPRTGRAPESEVLRRRLTAGRFAMEVDLISGSAAPGRLWIYQLRTLAGAVIRLSQLDREVVLEVPARATKFRLWPMLVSLPDGLPSDSGVQVHLSARETARTLVLHTTYRDTTRAVELGVSPAYAWSLFAPFEIAVGTNVRGFTALCLFIVFLLLGFWGGRSAHRAACAAAVIALTFIGLAAIPLLAHFPPVHWSEWAATALGVASGWALPSPGTYLDRRCVSPSDSESSSS